MHLPAHRRQRRPRGVDRPRRHSRAGHRAAPPPRRFHRRRHPHPRPRPRRPHLGPLPLAEDLALDTILQPPGGWGFDATGVGRVLVDLLAPELEDRLSGYVFNRATPAVDPTTGEAQLDPTSGREVLISYKELGTQLIERRLHGRGLELPYDPEVRHLLANHTYSQSGESRRFSKLNDHLVDALRVAELRKLTADWGVGTPPLTSAIPTQNPIDSLDLLRNL
ncbi:MAG TPA: hypothetical protein VJ885_13195 [Thermoanaerobaculia bacterium]|nr:hypothetical protein [Thermoanaerobaculia bacterium]